MPVVHESKKIQFGNPHRGLFSIRPHGLGVKEGWFRSQVKQGNGPTYLKPSPKTILFRDEDLDRWKASWKVVTR